MNSIEKLKQEHEEIERELIELEAIMEDEAVNYSNLLHVIKSLHELWDKHEQREERIFPILKNEKIIIPVKTMLFEHRELNVHKEAINKAIMSGSEFELKDALNKHGKIIIEKLRKHINYEDEILYRITLEIFTPKELDALEEEETE
ncbi:Hemerythrin HHE cation binding domain protein [uncultured archaeon]|nr:Hemerythrin HHE cation binding domain protein [uncultured archaeon]